MDLKLVIGLAAGILTAVSAIPQIIKTLKSKKAAAISPFMFFVLTAGNSLWLYYGMLLNDLPISITNGFSILCNLIMLFLHFKYDKK